MARSTFAKEQAAIAYAAIAKYIGVSSADPGTTGSTAVEPSGGGYARILYTATPGAVDGSVAVAANIAIPAGFTIGWVVYYDAVTGGNYCDSNTVTSQAFATAGTYAYTGTLSAS
jgi:hypothetical protein